MKRTGKRSAENGINELQAIYKGKLAEDRIALMGRILLAIRQERGITVEEISCKTGLDYTLAAQLIGMLETDGIISRDLLQRCFINFSR